MARRPSGCDVPDCDGAHINEGMCHFGDGPFKARGLCGRCYKKARRVPSERTLPHLHTLMPDDVREMRRMFDEGWSRLELSVKFGVSRSTVSAVLLRRTWTDLE